MKGRVFYFFMCASVFSSCSDHKDIYNPDNSNKQYEENWTKKFGDIDLNHTWNVATLADVSVHLDEDASVDFFYIDGVKNYNLAHYELKAGISSFSMDVPQGIKTVYAVKSGGRNNRELAVPVGDDGRIDVVFRTVANPRGLVESLSPQPRQKVNLLNAADYTGFADAYYAANEWKILGNIGSAQVDYLQTDLSGYPYTQAILEELNKAEGKESVLSKYANDFSAKTTNAGEISLVVLSLQTSANTAVGYFYTSENTEAAMKAAPKYILLPGIKQFGKGATLNLTYYGMNGDETPTFTFPKDLYVHFFLLRGAGNNDLLIPGNKNEKPSRYEINGLYQLYSSGELNTVASGKGGFKEVSVLANFSTFGSGLEDGVNILSFEDWPRGGMVDWNDFAFMLNGPFKSFKRFQEEFDWTVVFEDLGDTDDFDFNDVVLGVKHLKKGQIFSDGTKVITSSALEVYLCAAGGMLPASVQYDGKTICNEVHQAFGVSTGTMVNTTGLTKDYVSLAHIENVDPNFSLTNDANKFSIVVNGKTNVSFPQKGAVPQAICVMGTWAWPTERTSIADAYTGFTDWVANQSANPDWYKTPNAGKVVTE